MRRAPQQADLIVGAMAKQDRGSAERMLHGLEASACRLATTIAQAEEAAKIAAAEHAAAIKKMRGELREILSRRLEALAALGVVDESPDEGTS